jgi:NAD(P)-dependent dehydrogenase (short-subunit alcohol dehydrogenase family)
MIRPGAMAEPSQNVESYYSQVMAETSQQAIKRTALPEEQAAAIAFLASEDSSYITGQIINCCGSP